ncbi:MAG TPA: amino acid permease [Bryobacteraceae bacterium]|nr:amino acid permease [Bryobacteraceae bacterium]
MSTSLNPSASSSGAAVERQLKRSLGLFDSTMIVAGSMIGSGIFIVSSEMARNVGSPGWLLLSWAITGVLTLTAALSYGELAAMMPQAGGQYVYLREAFSPLWGFLYGWTLFMVIQTGTIAAVGVAFARYLGILWPTISESNYLIPPLHVSTGYAISLSTAQLVAILVILFLSWTNSRGLHYGKRVQNFFTVAKIGSLVGLVALGLFFGWNRAAAGGNFGDLWTPRGFTPSAPGLTPETAFGLLVALCVAQTGSLFSADAWNNITFTAGEVREPRRNVPLSLAFGTGIVIGLYILANVAYLAVLPLANIQTAPLDRVASAMVGAVIPSAGAEIMAIAIMISTFGCINGMVLAGARAFFAMARHGLFFRGATSINRAQVPGKALFMQAAWTAFLVLPRTYIPGTKTYGNLYGNLLDYVISAALIFYILTIAGVFVLRWKRPDAERPYRAFGYPMVPILYIAGAAVILALLFVYRPATTLPGLAIVLIGVPVFVMFRRYGNGV